MIYTSKLSVWASDGNGARNVSDDTVNPSVYGVSFPSGPAGQEDIVPPHTVFIRNSGDSTFYVGRDNVTETNGYPLLPGEQIELRPRSGTWVVCGPGDTSEARVLIVLGQ